MLPFKDRIRLWAIRLRYCYQTKVRHMDIDKSALVSFGTKLDKVNPRGIHIGAETYIASGTRILTHRLLHETSCRYIYRKTLFYRC